MFSVLFLFLSLLVFILLSHIEHGSGTVEHGTFERFGELHGEFI